jgi:hypothetical protein
MHSCLPDPSPDPPRRAVTAGRIAMRAIVSHSRIRVVGAFRIIA